MIKIIKVSNAFLEDYGVKDGMYKWKTNERNEIIDKGIFLGENANAWTLLHEFIHYLNHLFKLPQPILDFMDIIMHPKWWVSVVLNGDGMIE